MRTAIIEKTVYSAEDAMRDESLMEKIMLKNWDYEVKDSRWYTNVYEQFETDLEGTGFEADDIYFSGFSSQGDGAMFEGSFELSKDSELSLIESYVKDKRIVKLIKAGRIWLEVEFKHWGHYHHENSHTAWLAVELYGDHISDGYQIESYLNDGTVYEAVRDSYRDLCKSLYRQLNDEYNYLTSKEYLLDYFKQNNTEFYADGTIFYE